jgi:hypothetical protein
MKGSIISKELLKQFNAKEFEVVETIQALWSGYGKITRINLTGGRVNSVIAKNICFPTANNHPKGWNTNYSHQRKVKSYEVEAKWYKSWAKRCNEKCRIATCYEITSIGGEHRIILEDLDASGFPIRKTGLNIIEVKLGLKWLANFHSTFMNDTPIGLWKHGSYWHLATRPDELKAMEQGPIKENAIKFDKALSSCKYQTIIHGDAKVANFCFSKDMKQIVAVDFQYVGGGCGMKDVAYFIGSCLGESDCKRYESEILNYYFKELEIALNNEDKRFDFNSLKEEWMNAYPIAWADFIRFLLGWMPSHQKLNSYSLEMTKNGIKNLMNQA